MKVNSLFINTKPRCAMLIHLLHKISINISLPWLPSQSRTLLSPNSRFTTGFLSLTHFSQSLHFLCLVHQNPSLSLSHAFSHFPFLKKRMATMVGVATFSER